jgi:hypothetical protein
MTAITNIAKAARRALKRTFPNSKISVTSPGSIYVKWTDDGPTLEQVHQALVAAGCAIDVTAKYGDHYGGRRFLEANGTGFEFDRYNTTERAAEQQRLEQQRLDYEAERWRENEAVAAAQHAKDAALKPVETSPAVQDQTAFDAFEKLRLRAESDITSDAERLRRPTWAPPLILGEDLAEACLTLGYLTLDDKWIGRLWATFATPKRSDRFLREHVSSLPLTGITCRGFQFHAGEVRGPTHAILFEAQRTSTGEWQFGPHWYPSRYWSPKSREWERLVRKRERAPEFAAKYPSPAHEQEYRTQAEALTRQIAALDAEDLEKAQAHRERQLLHGRALELARLRILEFIHAPDAHMQAAGRLWGHCCICGKELTDPISLERGIGPECLGHKIDGIKHLAKDGHRPESIATIIGMPLDFVAEVLKEAAA